MMTNGPWPIKFRTDLEPLSYLLSDILLQEDPWLNVSTICTYPEPWEEQPAAKNETEKQTADHSFDITPCVGHYGHRVYGDVTIRELSNGNISFQTNSVGEGNLSLLFPENSTFRMDFAGRLPLVFGSNCEARFDELTEGLFQRIQLDCSDKYEFKRGIYFLDENDQISSAEISKILSFSVKFTFVLYHLLYTA